MDLRHLGKATDGSTKPQAISVVWRGKRHRSLAAAHKANPRDRYESIKAAAMRQIQATVQATPPGFVPGRLADVEIDFPDLDLTLVEVDVENIRRR